MRFWILTMTAYTRFSLLFVKIFKIKKIKSKILTLCGMKIKEPRLHICFYNKYVLSITCISMVVVNQLFLSFFLSMYTYYLVFSNALSTITVHFICDWMFSFCFVYVLFLLFVSWFCVARKAQTKAQWAAYEDHAFKYHFYIQLYNKNH